MSYLQTEKIMRVMAKALEDFLDEKLPGPKKGFALIIFEFNEPGISNYISNAERKDMIQALSETAERLERNQDIPAVIGGIQ